MRVLTVGNMYPPHHLGGYELMWRSAVHELREAGHQVRVLTTDHLETHPDPAITEDADVHRELRWYWRNHEFPQLGLRERLAIERHNLATLDQHLASFAPDAVCWWAMGGMSLSMLERVRSAALPVAGAVHDEWMIYGPTVDRWQRAFDRPVLRRLASAASGVPTGVDLAGAADWSFVSAYVRERAVAEGLDVGGSPVIHSGIDSDRFRPAPERQWEGRLLCLGRVDPRKGVATAVRALPELPECSLRCVGTGDASHLAQLRALTAELAVGDRVEFDAVERDRIPAAYADADVLLFCVSWPEPFGLVPLEAMAVGRPVIATRTGGSAEFLRDGHNCIVVPADDPGSIAEAVRRLGADPELRGRLRAGGFETAIRHTERSFREAIRKQVEDLLPTEGRRG
jgi:glycosyltransferase involved in cell wall biosynthesis